MSFFSFNTVEFKRLYFFVKYHVPLYSYIIGLLKYKTITYMDMVSFIWQAANVIYVRGHVIILSEGWEVALE